MSCRLPFPETDASALTKQTEYIAGLHSDDETNSNVVVSIEQQSTERYDFAGSPDATSFIALQVGAWPLLSRSANLGSSIEWITQDLVDMAIYVYDHMKDQDSGSCLINLCHKYGRKEISGEVEILCPICTDCMLNIPGLVYMIIIAAS